MAGKTNMLFTHLCIETQSITQTNSLPQLVNALFIFFKGSVLVRFLSYRLR
jgi:hypothetical protein